MFSDYCLLKLKWGFCRLYCFWKLCCIANRRGAKVVWQSLNSVSPKLRLRGSDQHAPQVRELSAVRNWKMPWKGRERSFKSWIPMQMPLPSQRRWKPFETSTSGGHWPKGHYHLKMWWNWRWKEPRSTEELELPNKFCALQTSRGPSRVRRPELIRFFQKVRSLIAWSWKLCPKTLALGQNSGSCKRTGQDWLTTRGRWLHAKERRLDWRMYLSLLSQQITMRSLADAPIIKDRLSY